MQETKKAFRAISKKNDLEAAVSALSNLKGVGPAMASGNQGIQGQAQTKGGKTIFTAQLSTLVLRPCYATQHTCNSVVRHFVLVVATLFSVVFCRGASSTHN